MILHYLDFNSYILRKQNVSFLLKLPLVKDTWLFNCTESTQFNFLQQSLKINNVSKLILPNLHILNISGLLGLLSTFNLTGRSKPLHIYAPFDLKYYIDLGKKYSRTNFSYVLYIHVLKNGLVINQNGYRMYVLKSYDSNQFFFIQSEKYGTFYLEKALYNNLRPGPLYGKLKKGLSFLMPDGFVLNGYDLTSYNEVGLQVGCISSSFYITKNFRVSLGNDFTSFF